MAIIDIAAPRDVEPAVRELRDVYVADIDDLQQVAGAHREEREDEAARAESIVAEELERFVRAWRGRQLAPTVTALRKHFLALAEAEAQRVASSIGGLDDRAKKAIFEAADGLAKKLLHQPQMALRQDDGDGVPLVLAVQRLFKLEVGDVPAREVEETEAAVAGANANANADEIGGGRPQQETASERWLKRSSSARGAVRSPAGRPARSVAFCAPPTRASRCAKRSS